MTKNKLFFIPTLLSLHNQGDGSMAGVPGELPIFHDQLVFF